MRKLSALGVLLLGVTVVADAAQRILTNPNPEAQLKRLFPDAVAFTPRSGDPPHFRAYATDPRTALKVPPIGYAFWTTDIVPYEHGYHGPIVMLVGFDLTGKLTGIVVEYNTEPYGYFSVEAPEFAAQFKGKSLRAPFVVGMDIDAVSRATISIASAARAVRTSARMVARQLLRPSTTAP